MKRRLWGVKWPPFTLLSTGEVGQIKHSPPQVCLVSSGSGTASLANYFTAKNTPAFPHPLYTYACEHTFNLLTPHNSMTVSAASNRHLPIAPQSSLLLNTGAHKRWAEFSLPTNFAMQRESADEVCQHALLTPNSQKTTGKQCAPVYGWQGIEEKRRGMTFQNI